MENKKYILKVCFGKCPFYKKTIERIGVFDKKKQIIGFVGLNCPYCKKQKKANLDEIDLIPEEQNKIE